MSNELLDDLLVINVEKVSVEDFNPDDSIEIWWKAKTQRPNQERKKYRKNETHVSAATTTSCDMDGSDSSDSSQVDLLDWDCWLDNYHDF